MTKIRDNNHFLQFQLQIFQNDDVMEQFGNQIRIQHSKNYWK